MLWTHPLSCALHSEFSHPSHFTCTAGSTMSTAHGGPTQGQAPCLHPHRDVKP